MGKTRGNSLPDLNYYYAQISKFPSFHSESIFSGHPTCMLFERLPVLAIGVIMVQIVQDIIILLG
jgi:hypothetical protein